MRELKKELWPIKVRVQLPTTASGQVINANNIEEWLDYNIGRFKDMWNVTYDIHGATYYFRNSETATFFSLKWN